MRHNECFPGIFRNLLLKSRYDRKVEEEQDMRSASVGILIPPIPVFSNMTFLSTYCTDVLSNLYSVPLEAKSRETVAFDLIHQKMFDPWETVWSACALEKNYITVWGGGVDVKVYIL